MASATKGYDFLDFGASKGGCIEFATARLGGKNGLGIDSDPNKVEQMRKRGYACIESDVTRLDLPPRSVRFVTMSHFLEHLSGLDAVRDAIKCAARVSTDFVFIQGPYFDADDRLRDQGLKFYWSDWHGHKCHLTTSQLKAVLDELSLKEYVIQGRVPVLSSLDPAIHPLDAPRDQQEYDVDIHPAKPLATFDPPLYREIVCLVRLRKFRHWDNVLRARKGGVLIDASVAAS